MGITALPFFVLLALIVLALIVLLIIGGFCLIVINLVLEIRTLSSDSLCLEQPNPRAYRLALAVASQRDQMFAELGFQPVGCYVLRSRTEAFIATWKHEDRPTYACLYLVADQEAYDFVTLFSDKIGLTTGSTIDGHLFPPPPGSYIQTFPRLALQRRWTKHQEAESYLMEEGRVAYWSGSIPFEAMFLDAIRRQADYVRTHFLWPARAIRWHFVRRNRLSGLSVQELVERRWLRLPHDLTPFD